MATTIFTVYRGDYGIPFSWTLYQSNGTTPFDLTDYPTIKFRVWKEGDISHLIVDGACNVANASAGTITYTPVSTDFTADGQYLAEIQASSNTAIVSFGTFTLNVEESP